MHGNSLLKRSLGLRLGFGWIGFLVLRMVQGLRVIKGFGEG
jgi:hypothetical protein